MGQQIMGFVNDLSAGSQCRPSLREIMTELNAYAAEPGRFKSDVECSWEEIGIQLKVDYELLRSIRQQNHDPYNQYLSFHHDCSFRDMISEWLKQTSPSPTWSSLVIALRRSNLPEFANRLESKYCKYRIIMSTLYT